MTDSGFRELMGVLTDFARPFTLVDRDRIRQALDDCGSVHALGPIVEPTAYLRGGRDRLERNEQFLEAVLVFVDALEELRPVAPPDA